MPSSLNTFISTIIAYTVALLIGVVLLITGHWFWGGAFILGSFAPLEIYYKDERKL